MAWDENNMQLEILVLDKGDKVASHAVGVGDVKDHVEPALLLPGQCEKASVSLNKIFAIAAVVQIQDDGFCVGDGLAHIERNEMECRQVHTIALGKNLSLAVVAVLNENVVGLIPARGHSAVCGMNVHLDGAAVIRVRKRRANPAKNEGRGVSRISGIADLRKLLAESVMPLESRDLNWKFLASHGHGKVVKCDAGVAAVTDGVLRHARLTAVVGLELNHKGRRACRKSVIPGHIDPHANALCLLVAARNGGHCGGRVGRVDCCNTSVASNVRDQAWGGRDVKQSSIAVKAPNAESGVVLASKLKTLCFTRLDGDFWLCPVIHGIKHHDAQRGSLAAHVAAVAAKEAPVAGIEVVQRAKSAGAGKDSRAAAVVHQRKGGARAVCDKEPPRDLVGAAGASGVGSEDLKVQIANSKLPLKLRLGCRCSGRCGCCLGAILSGGCLGRCCALLERIDALSKR
eukprot:m.57997 g.57997  ORF g.57997 m.57997 type:complete len:458 (+) comp7117_c0_seq1:1825-3198(+)